MSKRTAPLEKNDDIELKISALGSEGQGIGRVDGYAVFIPGALPGEQVRAHVIKAAPNYAIAKLMNIIEPSPSRVTPRCPVFDKCGGCSLQHLAYGEQLEYKRRVVADAFVHIGGVSDIEVKPVIGMDDPWRYRNKGNFPYGEVDGRVCTGFFAPRSHRLVPMDDCAIQSESAVAAAKAIELWANRYSISAYDEDRGEGTVRHAAVRMGSDGGVMAVIVTTGPLPNCAELIAMLRESVPNIVGIVHNINPARTNVILGDTYDTVFGEAYLKNRICGMDFLLSAASFMQVNSIQTERLYSLVFDSLSLCGTEKLVDLYCGIGTMSLLAARRSSEVIGIENVAEAVSDARTNAKLNGIQNASFICAEAESALPELAAKGLRPDAIILDPPRKGCDRAALTAIAECAPEKIAYVSCSPATLARDAKQLIESGYRIANVQPVDMFPQTCHVETVVLMTRGKS